MISRWIGACLLLPLGFVALPAQSQSLAAPRSFEAIAYSPTLIRLFWLPAEGATGYRLLRDGQPLTDLPASATEYADASVAPDSLHRYALRALHAGGESEPRTYAERAFPALPPKGARLDCDVLVAQANSSGVAAAYEAAKRGQKVVLIEATTRLGGMPVNGLSASDIRNIKNGSGFFMRFKERVTELYAAEGVKANGLKYEPRLSHQAMKSLLYEVPNLTILRRFRLAKVHTEAFPAESGAPERRRVTSVVIEQADGEGNPTGTRFEVKARFYIDATDCGDLAAWAGAPFRAGREPRSLLEPHNGVIYYNRQARVPLPGSTGKGDKRMQSYSYLLTVKDFGATADKTLPKPPGFTREEFDDPTLPDWKSTWASSSGTMPNGKFELNQHPKGGDLQEINNHYPTTNYRERARVDRLYRERVLRYFYYIQTVYGMKNLGLPDDEYRDSGGFPPLLYVREGRRIEGEQLPNESDITNSRSFYRPEGIGVADYPMDSHAVRVKNDNDTRHMGEGEWWLFHLTPWHALPFGVMVPRTLDNVLVTTAVSSTHVSYGTYRMEPARMQFGQAAGVGADIALRHRLTGRAIPVRQVQESLLPSPFNPHGDPWMVLHVLPDLPTSHRYYRFIQYLAVRGFIPLSGENFVPDAPTTRGELTRWLTQLAARADLPDAPFRLNRAALNELAQWTFPDRPATRAEVAVWAARLFSLSNATNFARAYYADTPDPAVSLAANVLAWFGADSILWDSWQAYNAEGKPLFRPDAPLSHADMLMTLYLIQMRFGPLFNDHPADFRNGRQSAP